MHSAVKKLLFVSLLVAGFSVFVAAQTKPILDSFSLSDGKLLNSPFLNAQELDKQYLLELNADRLLARGYSAESYTNWENTGLDGHYLSVLSIMYAATDDKTIKERLDYMIFY